MEAQTAGRFHLALIHGLNAGTDDLRHIGAAVQAHGHDARRKAVEIRNKADAGKGNADHGQPIEDEHQLHHQGRSAKELDIGGSDPLQGLNAAHAGHGHQRTQQGAQQDSEKCDNQGIAHAFQKEVIVAQHQFFHGC